MANYPKTRCVKGSVTATQLNAGTRTGTYILPPATGKNIKILDGWVRCIGSAASVTTAVILTDATPTTILSFPVASLTQNLVLRADGTNVTNTNMGDTMAMGDGLKLGCTVADTTLTTRLDYMFRYIYTPVNNIAT